MDRKEFKNIFGENAKANDFTSAYGGWYKQSDECIIVLELQKSNYGDYYMLNVKTFIQGSFENIYRPNKELIKSPMGDADMQEPISLKSIFNFDEQMEDEMRINGIKKLFQEHIVPFANKTLSKAGIIEMVEKGELRLLSSVKKELERLMEEKQ